MKYTPLTRFETLARRLVEGSFNRLLGGRLEPLEVATRLARALEDSQAASDNPDHQAADLFRIYFHPDDYRAIRQENPNLADELADYLLQLARQTGIALAGRPQVELTTDLTLKRQQLRVEATRQEEPGASTQLFSHAPADDEALAALRKVDAFLIVDGRRHVPLDQPLITLGRRIDNDVVLDSASVSRRHAQIRWRYGRFILYDLSGRGRTAVNGQPVREYVLQPGDVIALSNVLLIYGEGRDDTRYGSSGDPDDTDGQTLLKPPREA